MPVPIMFAITMQVAVSGEMRCGFGLADILTEKLDKEWPAIISFASQPEPRRRRGISRMDMDCASEPE